jgi:hypothetical protein
LETSLLTNKLYLITDLIKVSDWYFLILGENNKNNITTGNKSLITKYSKQQRALYYYDYNCLPIKRFVYSSHTIKLFDLLKEIYIKILYSKKDYSINASKYKDKTTIFELLNCICFYYYNLFMNPLNLNYFLDILV